MIASIIDELTDQFTRRLNVSDDQSSIKAIIASALNRLDIVPRDEFDAQSAVLQRTRERLNELEIQLQTLEQHLLTDVTSE